MASAPMAPVRRDFRKKQAGTHHVHLVCSVPPAIRDFIEQEATAHGLSLSAVFVRLAEKAQREQQERGYAEE